MTECSLLEVFERGTRTHILPVVFMFLYIRGLCGISEDTLCGLPVCACCRVLPVRGPVLLGYAAKRRSVDVDQHHHPNPGKSCCSALSY